MWDGIFGRRARSCECAHSPATRLALVNLSQCPAPQLGWPLRPLGTSHRQ